MASNRANVLRTLYGLLTSHEPLLKLLNHKIDATSISTGATIFADHVLTSQLPVPCLIFGFESGNVPSNQNYEVLDWNLDITIYAQDVYTAADILDEIEAVCSKPVLRSSDMQPVNSLRVLEHQRMRAETHDLITVRLTLLAKWARRIEEEV